MMQIEMMYFGQFAQAGADSCPPTIDSANAVLGFYDATVLKPLTATVSVSLDEDKPQVTYDLGHGTIMAEQAVRDAFWATITAQDGGEVNRLVNVIRLTNDAAFIAGIGENAALDLTAVQSLHITATYHTTTTGRYAVRPAGNTRFGSFARGTLIDTPKGAASVEELRVGDMVSTADNGPQPLVWRGKTAALATGNTAPIVIEAGALAPDVPQQRLYLSHQQNILLDMPQVAALFDVPEVLVAAKKLLGLPGVNQIQSDELIEYHHIMCAKHEILMAGGMACDSFFPSPKALAVLEGPTLHLLMRYFHVNRVPPDHYIPCRKTIEGKLLRRLLAQIEVPEISMLGREAAA